MGKTLIDAAIEFPFHVHDQHVRNVKKEINNKSMVPLNCKNSIGYGFMFVDIRSVNT